MLFDRRDVDVPALVHALRQSVSDDGLLSERLDVTPIDRTRCVPVGGTLRETLERHVRFTHIACHHGPMDRLGVLGLALLTAAACLLFPISAAVLSTLGVASIYARFGVHRWTALLAYPAFLVQAPLYAYALARRTFVWCGRRYGWRGRFDVVVVE